MLMSASDAAPLPRLGEVFFDVRGNSRSMRLSWYADTGVAVFSIWQGGVCTGTFRLPIDDLPRMVETLQRGPQGRRQRPVPAGDDPYGETVAVGQPRYPERPGYQSGSYPRPDDYHPADDYAQAHDYAQPDDYARPDDYAQPDDFGTDFGQDYRYSPPGPEQFIDTGGGADYGQERFVPPYVRGQGGGYPIDNRGDEAEFGADYGQPAFRPDRQPGPSRSDQYPEPPWSSVGYSEDPRYRLGPDSHEDAYSAGAPSSAPGSPQGWPEPDETDLRQAGNRARRRDYRRQGER
jgi:hypothetical protein